MLTGYTLTYALLAQLTGHRIYADLVIIKMPIKRIYVINTEYAKNAVNFLCFLCPIDSLLYSTKPNIQSVRITGGAFQDNFSCSNYILREVQ